MNQHRFRCLHLAIAPSTHPDMDFQLTLHKGLSLPNNSYVKIETPQIVPVEYLKRLDYGPRRLTRKSYTELQNRIHFKLPLGFQPPSSRTTRPNPKSQRLGLLDINHGDRQSAFPHISPNSGAEQGISPIWKLPNSANPGRLIGAWSSRSILLPAFATLLLFLALLGWLLLRNVWQSL